MNGGRGRFWRLFGFATVYGLAAFAVTAVFWRSPQPTADQPIAVSTLTTSSPTTTTTTSTLSSALQTAIPLSTNAAYGISGTAEFQNDSTVILRSFSIIGRGPKIEIQLRDANDLPLITLKDISQTTLDKEDLVLAIPATTTLDLAAVTSLAIVAPDYNLVLSRATWR